MRKIIHVDMDCFFAAVEMRDNPALRDIPIAIGGSRERRGVISTANYPARKFGVRSAMPTGMALKLCPHLTLLPGALTPTKKPQIISAKFSRAIPRALNRYHWMKPISMSPIASIATVLRPSSPRNPPDDLQRAATDGVCGRGTSKVSRQNRLRHE